MQGIFNRYGQWMITGLLLLSLNGCNNADTPAASPDLTASLPASFSGQLPCADCPGINLRLNLFADNSFYLRQQYQDRQPGTFYSVGRWRHQQDSLQLISNDHVPRFQISPDGHLKKLDQQGHIIESPHNHTLYRDPDFAAVYPRGQFTGMYRYEADGGLFTECQTGQSWPVAASANGQRLQSLYQHYARQPGQPLYAEVTGRLEAADNPDNAAASNSLVVEENVYIWPAESCGEPGSQEKLLDTHWQLTRIHQTPVPVETGTFSDLPYLQLSTETSRFGGSDGCNQLMGQYRLEEDRLLFSKIASTRKACLVEPVSAPALYTAMEQVRHWQIDRHQLILKNASGETLLRFEAKSKD